MPIYVLYCKECNKEIEQICSWEIANMSYCTKCGTKLEFVPCKAGFNIEGASYANGYTGSDVGYDGVDRSW